MDHVVHGDALARAQGGQRLAHGHAVEGDDAPEGNGLARELVLGGYVFHQLNASPANVDGIALRKIAQGHNQVVVGIDTEDRRHGAYP